MPVIKMFGSGSMEGVQLLEGKTWGFVEKNFDTAWFDLEAPREWAIMQPVKTSLARWLVANVRSTERVASNHADALLIEFILEGEKNVIQRDWSSFTPRSRLNTRKQYEYWLKEANAILKLEKGARVTRVQVRGITWMPLGGN